MPKRQIVQSLSAAGGLYSTAVYRSEKTNGIARWIQLRKLILCAEHAKNLNRI